MAWLMFLVRSSNGVTRMYTFTASNAAGILTLPECRAFSRFDVSFRQRWEPPSPRPANPCETPIPMPRIRDATLETVFYLYPSRAAAEAGRSVGGTGFFVGIESEAVPGNWFVLAVSNRHVVHRGGASVMRVNTEDGGVAFLEFEPHEWIDHPAGDDLAVIPMPGLRDDLRVTFNPINYLLTKEQVAELDIGPGDDVFMVGRFINHEGKSRNIPAVRFGNISAMPLEKVQQPSGFMQESFLVEMRSHAGFSGSPVHVYRPTRVTMEYPPGREKFPIFHDEAHGTWLLGVNWGYITDDWEITRKTRAARLATAEPPSAEYVQANTGMNGVVPAWKVLELVSDPRLEGAKMVAENQVRVTEQAARGGIAYSGAETKEDRENPNHREDFNRLVGAASKSKPKGGRT
jgi:hypothetical protein